ncbi:MULTISPECIES: hypothetical protein [Streptomyces]|nr:MULTISPECIES: hypothetical protein [Streptomyces]MDX2837138.1 hypothetical protein [Streptomyces scabiei]MDX3681761.1 hypothetical protein [Streptomyces scabiei]
MNVPKADAVNRTALIGLHDGTHPTFEAVLAAHAATGIAIVTDPQICERITGQAALCTAIATAVRAFGNVVVVADGRGAMATGPHRSHTVADVVGAEGACLASDLSAVPKHWPVLLICATEYPRDLAGRAVTLQVDWSGWIARVYPGTRLEPVSSDSPENLLAAITAAALGVHEAFGAVQARPGSDAGRRSLNLNLWRPGTESSDGPPFTFAPASWWLVGLGHLGQANAWVLSWLPYADPAQISVVLQDVDKAAEANHSTGLLTPRLPAPTRKTRLVAETLDRVGFDTSLVERRLDQTTRAAEHDTHVALLGVDNLATRRAISVVGWPLAIDAGLGSGALDFNAIQIRRFPAARASQQVAAWAEPQSENVALPNSGAFEDLKQRDVCGAVELGGTAVGAAFVGVVAACLAISEASRELAGGLGHDVLSLHLGSDDLSSAPSSRFVDVVPARLSAV